MATFILLFLPLLGFLLLQIEAFSLQNRGIRPVSTTTRQHTTSQAMSKRRESRLYVGDDGKRILRENEEEYFVSEVCLKERGRV